jgi:hypothetical protein
MRFLTTAAVSLAALIAPIQAGGESVAPVATQTQPQATHQRPCPTRWEHRRLLRQSVRYSNAGGDYHASPIKASSRHRLALMRKCAQDQKRWSALKQERRDYRHKMKAWRFHRYIDQITPYGEWAIPTYIVMRESGGDPCAANPNSTAGGYYQFLYTTWTAYGGSSSGPTCAPAWEQHLIAYRAWNDPGTDHWALTR